MFRAPNLWNEFLAILLRQPRPSAGVAATFPEHRRFSTANGPISSIVVPIMIVGLLGDVPLSWVLVSLCHPAHPWLVHAIVFVAGLYAVGWALAVRSASRSIPHAIDEHALWLGGGVHYGGKIPRSSIRRTLALHESRHAWTATHQVRMRDVLIVSRPDAPNVAIELEDSAMAQVRLTCHRKTIAPRRWILLYVDRPGEFATAAS
jgi:hypothetical protein